MAKATVELRFARGPLLDLISPSFAHLQEESAGEPGLTVFIWDSRSTGAPLPPRPSALPTGAGMGPIYYYCEGPFEVAYRPNSGILSAFNRRRRVAWFHADDGSTLDYWEQAEPLRQILFWWLGDRRIDLVHAAAVGNSSGGVLLGGVSGSGKSTSSLACLASELSFAGDDYVAVDRFGKSIHVHSLYSSGKLEADHASRLPHLRPALDAGEGAMIDGKVVVPLAPLFPDRMCSGFPLRAILIPKITGDGPRTVPITPTAALTALAPSTLLQVRPTKPTALSDMGRLVQQVPCFALELGGDIDAIPAEISRLLQEL